MGVARLFKLALRLFQERRRIFCLGGWLRPWIRAHGFTRLHQLPLKRRPMISVNISVVGARHIPKVRISAFVAF